jgi:hypothetical protein
LAKAPQSFLWAGSRPSRVKITLNGIPNIQTVVQVFTVYTHTVSDFGNRSVREKFHFIITTTVTTIIIVIRDE